MTDKPTTEAAPEAYLDSMTTLTGESLVGALLALDEKLPDGAYKAVSMGGRNFTDISPAYSTEEIGAHFGPLGVGWGYTIEDEHVSDHATKDGKHYRGVVLRIELWYAYIPAPGCSPQRVVWHAYGGNANAGSGADEHFSWQGALTNAIGKGWSLQGFQRTIYKGEDFTPAKNADDAPAAKPSPSTRDNAPQARQPSTSAPSTPTSGNPSATTPAILKLMEEAIAAGADKVKLNEWIATTYGTSLIKDIPDKRKVHLADALRKRIAKGEAPDVADALGAEDVTEPEASDEPLVGADEIPW